MMTGYILIAFLCVKNLEFQLPTILGSSWELERERVYSPPI